VNLTEEARNILLAISAGDSLKSYRDIEGFKSFQLISVEGEVKLVEKNLIKDLRQRGLIDSNKKFPVSTFWLTELGKSLINNSGR